jgi:hypothetical protein
MGGALGWRESAYLAAVTHDIHDRRWRCEAGISRVAVSYGDLPVFPMGQIPHT